MTETLIVKFKNRRRIKLLRNRDESEEQNVYGGIRKLDSEEVQRWENLLSQHPAPKPLYYFK